MPHSMSAPLSHAADATTPRRTAVATGGLPRYLPPPRGHAAGASIAPSRARNPLPPHTWPRHECSREPRPTRAASESRASIRASFPPAARSCRGAARLDHASSLRRLDHRSAHRLDHRSAHLVDRLAHNLEEVGVALPGARPPRSTESRTASASRKIASSSSSGEPSFLPG